MFDSLFYKRFANRYKQNVQSVSLCRLVVVWLVLKMTLFELATLYNFKKRLFYSCFKFD